MKLQEFVSETLREIIGGVKEAQAFAKESRAVVNPEPEHIEVESDKWTKVLTTPGSWICVPIRDVTFDVAVTSTDTSETQKGEGIYVAAFGMGVKGKSDTVNSCVSRIRFSVPLALPANVPE